MTSEPRDTASKPDEKNKMSSGSGKAGLDVNVVLRRAYESAVDEDIPSSMLDLLEKLN